MDLSGVSGALAFGVECLAFAWAVHKMRRHGSGNQQVPASVSTIKLFNDADYLSPKGRVYRILSMVLILLIAATFKLVSFLSPPAS